MMPQQPKLSINPATVLALVKEKGEFRQAADHLGVSAATVHNYLRSHGLAGSMPQRAKPHALLPLLEPIKQDYLSGLTVAQVAEKYSSSYTSVLNLLRRYAPNEIRGYETRHQFRVIPERRENPEEYDKAVSRQYAKRIYRDNPERSAKKQRDWRKANPEAARKYVSAWIRNNREKVRVINRNRRARRKRAEGSHEEKDIKRIYALLDGRCAYCGAVISLDVKHGYHVDHIKSLEKGGSNWPENLALCCPSCNCRKGSKSLKAFIDLERDSLNPNYEYLLYVSVLAWMRAWGSAVDMSDTNCRAFGIPNMNRALGAPSQAGRYPETIPASSAISY